MAYQTENWGAQWGVQDSGGFCMGGGLNDKTQTKGEACTPACWKGQHGPWDCSCGSQQHLPGLWRPARGFPQHRTIAIDQPLSRAQVDIIVTVLLAAPRAEEVRLHSLEQKNATYSLPSTASSLGMASVSFD